MEKAKFNLGEKVKIAGRPETYTTTQIMYNSEGIFYEIERVYKSVRYHAAEDALCAAIPAAELLADAILDAGELNKEKLVELIENYYGDFEYR